jgi:outer membrane protein assembly factor BamE (lipoprotein component of BamABCDE complex)
MTAGPRSHRTERAPLTRIAQNAATIALIALAGCVTENTQTGKMVPRGEQGMQFSDVEEAAEKLKDGMTKQQVMFLLGSPAEKDDSGDVWIYLPERYAILIPARALRLEFKNAVLVEHGYRPIVLGARL